MKKLSDEVVNNLIEWKSSCIPQKVIGQRLYKMGVKNKLGNPLSRHSVSLLMRSQGLRTMPERTKPKVEIKSVKSKTASFLNTVLERKDLTKSQKLAVLEVLL